MMDKSWNQFLAERTSQKRWCVAARMTPNLRDKGFECVLTPKRYKELEDEWQRLRYGARLESIEAAAPELFRALKILVHGAAPPGLYPQLAPAELLRRIENDEINPHYQRAARFELENIADLEAA